ncbi:hypothetical protein HBI13_213500 [Parastagonospora nodorum]|nr:hypothetical protein HBI10_105180 [Parastagonospora nodorum]KAH4010060.1 hypothetical protein HBI13_213500 [Parastagonospora nodorum]
MSTYEYAKRKSTAADHIDAEHPKPVTAANPVPACPWLAREQNISEQDLWVIYCRENLVPGAISPKNWETVGVEFNEHFEEKLKQPLSYTTLQRRLLTSRKRFYADNPDYLPALVYLVPMSAHEDEGDVVEDSVIVIQPGLVLAPVSPPAPQNNRTRRVKKAANEKEVQPPGDPKVYLGSSSLGLVAISDSQYGLAGAWSAIDRAKYYLRRRTKDRIVFNFMDASEQNLAENDVQFIEHDKLLMASPFYARLSRADPARVVGVPEDFCVKTVNAFSQMISPVHAKALPTHYLWPSEKPVAGAYDRFGAVQPEKINWSVSYLLKLHVFARHMQVWFVCDMVLDRMHWMINEQAKFRGIYGQLKKQDDCTKTQGQIKTVCLPPVSDLDSFSIAADDIEPAWLRLLAERPIDTRSLTFFRDAIHALGGSSETDWLDDTYEPVQDLFKQADVHGYLTNASREQFCTQYHHHTDGEPCYTAAAEHSTEYFVELLYTTTSRDELLMLSKHAASPNGVTSMTYPALGPAQDLKSANSSREMLKAEKLVLMTEIELGSAKAALLKARKAGPKQKERAIKLAKRMAQGLRK